MELDPYHPDYYLDNIDFFGEPATNFSSSYSMSKAKQVFFAAVPTRLTYIEPSSTILLRALVFWGAADGG
nr:hypothetical protein BgiMline_019113 [Biomphalaria glabrata]